MMNFYAPYLGTGQSTLVAGVAGLTYANSSGYLAFYTSDGTTNSERVRVDSSGNVGIGTTSPNAKLDVYGTISATNLMLGGVAIASQTDRITSGTAAVTANYNTGVSVSAPLHVNGAVKIAGTNSEPCGPSSYGTIRYNSTLKAFQICRE